MQQRLSPDIISEIQRLKTEGLSHRELALKYHVAKSTISLHVRDVFRHPAQRYHSYSSIIQATTERTRKARARGKYHYPRDYAKERARRHSGGHPHDNCPLCGAIKRKDSHLCINCFKRQRLERAQYLDGLKAERRRLKEAQIIAHLPPIHYNPCPKSPTGSHHWLIDSRNGGVCKYCETTKDFSPRQGTGDVQLALLPAEKQEA